MNIVLAHGANVNTPSGGANRVIGLANGLAAAGHDVSLVCPGPSDGGRDEMVRNLSSSVRIDRVGLDRQDVLSQPVRGLAVSRRAKRLADRRDALIQFEHSTLGGVGALTGCRGYVLDMHDLAFSSPFYRDLPLGKLVQRAVRRFEGMGIGNADRVVVVSDEMRRIVREIWDYPDDRLVTIPNGYFREVVEPYLDTPTEPGRVVFLGSLHPKLDLESFASIADLSSVNELIVVGDGALRDDLDELATTHDRLHVRGRLPDEEAYRLVASAAVGINPQQPSRLQQASSPVKLFYYAALRLPMVVTSGPDLVTRLAREGAAIAVRPGDSFATAVDSVLSDEGRRAKMRGVAEELASEFTWDQRAADLVDMYRSL